MARIAPFYDSLASASRSKRLVSRFDLSRLTDFNAQPQEAVDLVAVCMAFFFEQAGFFPSLH